MCARHDITINEKNDICKISVRQELMVNEYKETGKEYNND